MIIKDIINKKDKKLYKKEAIQLKPNIYIGKNGMSINVLSEIKKQLKLKKLIKIKVYKQENISNLKNIAIELVSSCKANIINIIGHTIVLYKK